MIRRLSRSFVNGLGGLTHAIGSERNLQIHGVIAICVIPAGFYLALAAWEWIAVLLCIGTVIAAECMNTAIERLADRVSLEKHPLIKQAKDCGSAGVLVLAMTAAVVGGIVFAPKIFLRMGW